MPRLTSIQYLRALAAAGVAVFHAADRLDLGASAEIGAAGVDIFFVISGFVMWTVTAQRPGTPMRFLFDRATRIIPLYWIFTLSIAAMALVLPTLLPRLKLTLDHLVYSLFFIPHYAPGDNRLYPLLAAGWTLNYEMFFYALFAAFLPLPPIPRLRIAIGTLAALAAAGILYQGHNPVALTYTNALLLEFAAGLLIGRAWELDLLSGRWVGIILTGTAIGAFLLGIVFRAPDQYRVLIWGIPASLLVCGFLSLERAGAMRKSKMLELIGDGSYSIYLVHGNLTALMTKIWPQVHSPKAITCFLTASLAGSIAAGMISYRFLERPLISGLRMMWKRDRSRPMAVKPRGSAPFRGAILSTPAPTAVDVRGRD